MKRMTHNEHIIIIAFLFIRNSICVYLNFDVLTFNIYYFKYNLHGLTAIKFFFAKFDIIGEYASLFSSFTQ